MLSQKTIDTVKSTAPILQQHGEALTTHFYKRMFTHNPEVLPLFNRSNQQKGTQQRALAGAIAAYAANIDNLSVLTQAVELIAQKHASLKIQPHHYPIVGENLLASIKEVLGDGATPDIIDAWGQAYEFLAGILQGREQEIYETGENQKGGWQGFRSFTVDRKIKESQCITSFYLKPKDGEEIPLYRAGQYLTVRIPTEDGLTTMRNYSLSDKAGQGYLRISVKREASTNVAIPAGYASNFLHDKINEGDLIDIGMPCGEFVLSDISDHNSKKPLVLLAAGVGATPIMSMLLTALEHYPSRDITFIQAALNEDVHPFKQAVDGLDQRYKNLKVYYRYSDSGDRSGKASTGFVTDEYLRECLDTKDCEYYFCGPNPYMASLYKIFQSWNVCESAINFEFFGPKQDLIAV